MPLVAQLATALAQERGDGIFHIAAHVPVLQLKKWAKEQNYAFFHLEGKHVANKLAFLNQAGIAMHFPEYAGRNWDAFEELICDLSWVEGDPAGYLIYFDHIDNFMQHHLAEVETLVEIFADAVAAWRDEDRVFCVLLQGSMAPSGSTPLTSEK
jgi:hypothetical protein